MALTERLALLVSLDANGAIKGLNDVGKAADRNLGRADTRVDRFAQGFQKAGVGMLAASGLLATGLYKAGQSAADLEQAIGGTEAVFKDASGTIDKFAEDSAKNMGLSERAFREATTSIGGQLKGLGFDTDDAATKAVELTAVAADLAATYAKAVALGLAESTAQVDAQAKAQATLALITEQSADAQGQFARETDSASGSMQIASAEFENAKAALGESVAPVLADVSEKLGGLARGFKGANDASGGLLSKLAAYGTIALGAAGGLSFVIGKTIALRDNLSGLTSKFRNAEGGLSRLGKGASIASGALGILAAVEIAKSMNVTTVSVDKLAASLAKTDTATRESVEGSILLASRYGELDEIVKQTAETNLVAAERLLEAAEAAGINGDELQSLKDIVAEQGEANVQGAKDQETNTAALEAAVGPTGELAGETGTLAERVAEANEAYGNLIDTVLGFANADLALRESIDKTDDALFDLAAAQEEAADKGGKNREANEALEDALNNVEGSMYSQAEAAVKAAEDQAKLAGTTLSAADKQAILRASLDESRNKLAPGSPLRNNLNSVIDDLDRLAQDRTANVDIFIREQRIALTTKRDGERASGGPVSSGKTYLVGERGPELVTMGSSGYVTPNDALGGGSSSTVVNINVSGSDPQKVVEAVQRYIKSNGQPVWLRSA
jgi:hypothetical protein